MKCKDIKILMMDFLYDEILDKDKQLLTEHLTTCKECSTELQTLQKTSKILNHCESLEPNLNFVFVSDKKTIWNSIKEKITFSPKKIGYSFALGFAVVLLLMSLINMEFSYTQGDFSIKMSLLPRDTVAPDNNIADQQKFAANLNQQDLQLMNTLIQRSEERQRKQLISTLAQFSRDFENRRNADLQMVGVGFDEIEKNIYSRVQRKTNTQINDLIKLINTQQRRK